MNLDLNENNVFPLLETSNNTKRIAEKALNNIIEPFPKFDDIEFKKDFDWEYKHPKVETSYQLYLQNLRVVNELLNQYRETANDEFIIKSKEIIESWFDYIDAGNETKMTWYDHAIGARSQVLIDFFIMLKKKRYPLMKIDI
ncbi:heparinase II/III family protein [Jeotgalicoccus sp. WY2]|uniref:heparinase II/III family protein n=1 Tax=Jeotgalicoccus sp. WY2 TaxID=2708346 RepID=UPI001BD65E73|nr:heparinase II/III family protein [Jeotgalicoccus sp. WY2]